MIRLRVVLLLAVLRLFRRGRWVRPDDTPGLTTPSQYPDEPITEGLPIGPGGGPQRDTRLDETRQLRRYLPLLEVYINRPDTPDSVRALFRYIRGA